MKVTLTKKELILKEILYFTITHTLYYTYMSLNTNSNLSNLKKKNHIRNLNSETLPSLKR